MLRSVVKHFGLHSGIRFPGRKAVISEDVSFASSNARLTGMPSDWRKSFLQSRAVSGVRASPSNKADLGYTLRNTFSVTKGRHSMKVKGSSIAGAELPETHPAHEADGKISLDDLFARKYTEIRELASRLRWKGGSPTLGPTALANEAYLKLLKDPPDLELKSYDNLIGVFANAMRQILVDASRRKLRSAIRSVCPKTQPCPLRMPSPSMRCWTISSEKMRARAGLSTADSIWG